MNWETIAAVSEAVGAIAVVVSLIYLAVQIRQNTKAIRGTTIDAITAHQQEELRWSSEMPEVFRKALEEPEALTYEESWRLSEWMTSAFTARQNEYHQYREGLLDEEVWLSIENIIRLLMGLPYTQTWWNDHGSKNLTPSFVAKVDSILAEGERYAKDELKSVLPGQ